MVNWIEALTVTRPDGINSYAERAHLPRLFAGFVTLYLFVFVRPFRKGFKSSKKSTTPISFLSLVKVS